MNFSEYYIYDENAEFSLRHTKDRRNVVAGSPVKASKGSNGYRLLKLLGKTYRLHRVVWMLHNGPIPDGMEVDHIDRNVENNRIENLRLATKSQNAFNRANKAGKALPKGIVYIARDNIYQARVMKQGERYHYHSKDLDKCLKWLDEMRSKLHGEYRCD